jgi:hypothetical protein
MAPPQPTAAAAPPAEPPAPPAELTSAAALAAEFSPDAAMQFRGEVEKAIELGAPPDEFARQFAQMFPEAAKRLATYSVHDMSALVEAMPGGAGSPVLRRDGRKWLQQMWATLKKATR